MRALTLPSPSEMPAALKALRGSKTRVQMAKLLQCGLSTYNTWEKGTFYPTKKVSCAILEQLFLARSKKGGPSLKDARQPLLSKESWHILCRNPLYPRHTLETYSTWAQYLKYCRRALGYTPQDIAKNIPVSESIYREYEHGRTIRARNHQPILKYLLQASVTKGIGLPEVTFPVYAEDAEGHLRWLNTTPKIVAASAPSPAPPTTPTQGSPTLTMAAKGSKLTITGPQDQLAQISFKICPAV